MATWSPYETVVLETIRDMGLELQVIFNKGAVMVLPSGVNKGTGLAAALEELELSAHNVVGVGDAENDHAFLKVCECSVAVANALPALKERADAPVANAIPWLLLAAKSVGPEGSFSKVTSIQRVNTVGGVAPQAGCSQATAGAAARINYTADYYFFTAK